MYDLHVLISIQELFNLTFDSSPTEQEKSENGLVGSWEPYRMALLIPDKVTSFSFVYKKVVSDCGSFPQKIRIQFMN